MKIVLLEERSVSAGDVSFDEFYRLGEVRSFPLTPQERLAEYVGEAEAAICNKSLFTRDILDQCRQLRYIGLCATGYNNIDIRAASEMGITVTNVPDYSSRAVAQQVFSYVLHFANRTADYNADVHAGGWIRSESFSYFTIPTFELAGRIMGIIGMGSIGRLVTQIARSFGMEVIYCTRTPRDIPGASAVSMEELFSRADFISLHCPLTHETAGLVNMNMLRLCKKSAYLINTSRGGAVNEADLAQALSLGLIAGAAVDVISEEPMKPGNPLMEAPNCIITPHVAWAPLETRKRLVSMAAENLRRFIEGNPINAVND